jgi:hypothetical protein
VALIAGALAPAAASADPCPAQPTAKIFSLLGDPNDYFLAPGSDFEGPLTWENSEGASITTRRVLTMFAGPRMLELEPGASSTSPPICVDVTRPHLRFGVRAVDGSGTLALEGLTADGSVTQLATVDGSRQRWYGVTPMLPLAPKLGLTGQRSGQVRLRLTALSGTWNVDGVAVDPAASR